MTLKSALMAIYHSKIRLYAQKTSKWEAEFSE